MAQAQGELIQSDFFQSSGGLNITDSPIRVSDSQATGGYNYEYSLTGGFAKRLGHSKLNSSANTQTQALGHALLIDQSNVKTPIRTAGTKIQSFVSTTGVATNLTEDTVSAGSDFIPSSQKRPSIFSQFNTVASQTMWVAGSNMTAIYGVYSSSKATKNGSNPPTGVVATSVAGAGGSFTATGTYFYAIALRKASTQAISNVALDVSATISATTDEVTLDFSGLTSLDTTKYDKILIYRSAVAGVTGFTTGVLVATIASSSASYTDLGTSTLTTNVPRAGNVVLDNSVLPSGTFNSLATFKRRLVTATASTVYLSDLNKPESWPATNTITIPSGGPITGVAVVSYATPTSASTDEFLAVFKENELWVITGTDYNDWALKFVDTTGCINQKLIVVANGYLAWVDYRGIYLWDGSGKPIYTSRPIEFQFSTEGTLDKSKFDMGWATFHKRTNQIIWYLSDTLLGEQQYGIKMDVRLTLPSIENSLQGRILDGVFLQDKTTFPLYGGSSVFPTTTETLYAGDASGYIYEMYSGTSDGGSGIDFSYETKLLDLDRPSQTKRYNKVIVWIEDSTDQNLTLDYWVGYNTNEDFKNTQFQPVSRRVTRGLWDVAYWDSANWDSNTKTYSPLVFNLYSPQGNEGDCIKIRFSQGDANAPVRIAGFTLLYTLAGLRK